MEHYEPCSFRKKVEKKSKGQEQNNFNTFNNVLFSISQLHN